MKRMFIISLFMIGLVAFGLDVRAEATNADPGDDNYSTLQSAYNKGNVKNNVSGSGTITVYGKAECNGSSCTINYVDGITDIKSVLKKSVVCTDGKQYINYTALSQGSAQYVEGTSVPNGTSYFSDEFYVTCVESNGSVKIENTANTTVDDSSNTNNNYNSSSTVKNEQTGVNTYFIILGLVAVISYVFMIFVKKFNLFKKI